MEISQHHAVIISDSQNIRQAWEKEISPNWKNARQAKIGKDHQDRITLLLHASCFMLLPKKKKWRSQKKKSKMRSEKTKNSKRKEKTCSRYENFPNELPQVDPPSWKSCISKYSDGKKHSTVISLKFYKKIINIRLGNSIMSSKNYDNVIRWHSDHFDVYVLDLKKHGRQRQKEFP